MHPPYKFFDPLGILMRISLLHAPMHTHTHTHYSHCMEGFLFGRSKEEQERRERVKVRVHSGIIALKNQLQSVVLSDWSYVLWDYHSL